MMDLNDVFSDYKPNILECKSDLHTYIAFVGS